MRDCKKGFISISIVYTFLILFIFLMLAILASYITRENLLSKLVGQSKDIIYNGTADDNLDNNITVKVYIDGVYAKLFPSKTYYDYSSDTSYCTSAAVLNFDNKNWSASLSNISGRTTCMIYFISKEENTNPNANDDEDEVIEPTPTPDPTQSGDDNVNPSDPSGDDNDGEDDTDPISNTEEDGGDES